MLKNREQVLLITGFPLITARQLILHISKEKNSYVAMLVPKKFEASAKSFIEKNNLKTNVRLVVGDIASMHLGFSSEEYRFLLKNVTDLYHLASIYYPNTSDSVINKVNITGTKNIIQFVKDSDKQIPLNYLSTCMVFENYSGLVPEEPVSSPSYSCYLYKSRFIAESMIMSEQNLIWRIFRAPMIGGDSKTGETDRLGGFYALLYLLMISDVKVPIPVPHRGRGPLNMVPIDYLVKVLYHISTNPESTNRIFHIVDPNPLSIRVAFELISKEIGKRITLIYPPANLLNPLLKLGIAKRIIPSYVPLIEILNQFIIFSHSNTDKFLKNSNIEPPQFENYLRQMISFVKNWIEQGRREIEYHREEDPYGDAE
ncbi:MAG: SDR family oxidoreductase [Myxococcota bacterium]